MSERKEKMETQTVKVTLPRTDNSDKSNKATDCHLVPNAYSVDKDKDKS